MFDRGKGKDFRVIRWFEKSKVQEIILVHEDRCEFLLTQKLNLTCFALGFQIPQFWTALPFL